MDNTKNLMIRIGVIAILLILALSITACSGIPSSAGKKPAETKYYQGYKGVETTVTRAMPPDKMYFYGDTEDNTFDVNVEVANQGASWARGGLYISGYDPTMIEIAGITPDRANGRDCVLNIGNLGFGKFDNTFTCSNFFIGEGDNFKNMGVFIKNLGSKFQMGRLTGGVDLGWMKQGKENQFSLSLDNPNIDVDYSNHGRLLILASSALNFQDNFGLEYLLAGNNYEYPGGELAFMNFDGNIVSWPPGLDQTTQTFMITNCYVYSSYAAPVVCIDPAPFSENDKVCTPKPYTGTSGQGAPVAVTYIEQENTPRQAVFKIFVKNTGGGKVYDPGRLYKCSPYSPARVTAEDLNVVIVGDVRVSGDPMRLKCTPNDYIRLDPKTGEGLVTCVYDIPFSGLKSAYQAPLVVELWYGYSKSMEKKVTIKRAV
ncbi:MAG: hypothetical protein V1866_07110 [archaeon]